MVIMLALVAAALPCCGPIPEQGWASASSPGSVRAEDPGMESNIIRVNKFFSADPWLCFNNDGTGRVDGVRLTVYLEGASQPKGVFGNGSILVEMYRLDRDAKGSESAALLHSWELPPHEAYPWRAKRPTGMGWGYGLRLPWPDELDVAGRQVAFLVKYRRDDGRLLSSSRQVLRVPAPRNLIPLGK